MGVTMTNKMARIWPGGPTAFDAHQYTSLLGLTFALFHAIILFHAGALLGHRRHLALPDGLPHLARLDHPAGADSQAPPCACSTSFVEGSLSRRA